MNAINWPIVWRIGLQGVAILLVMTGALWSLGFELLPAFRGAMGIACGWLGGHLQRHAGGVKLDLSVLRKDKP
jgi:hypothetical protein